MYQTHWGLEKPPFPSGVDARLFYEGASQRESLARLRFLLTHRRQLGFLLGESGLGKSLLLEVFAEQSRRAGLAVARLSLLGLSSREFYWKLGSELQAAVRVDDDQIRLFRQVTDRLHENSLQNKQTLILLDNFGQAGPDLLSQVLRLANTDAAKEGNLTFVAAACSGQLNRLGQSFLELIDLRIELLSWDELDTTGYLQMALLEAGAAQPLFDDEAISFLHRLSEGVPRRVNQLADSALLVGLAAGQEIVDAATVEAASESVSLPTLV